MEFLAFDKEWFEKHQQGLLWLLNNRLTKRWFRWVLQITKHDVGYEGIIVKLLPNSYTVFSRFVDERVELRASFLTDWGYSKRLYSAFRPLWWMLHFWDWLIADRLAPKLSFGFSTLTVYPDAGTGATTVDGYVVRTGVDETFATIRGGAGNGATSTDLLVYLEAHGSSANQFSSLGRGIMTFDTSSLGASATISAATLTLYNFDLGNGFGDTPAHICAATPASNNNLVNADYSQLGSTSFANIPFASVLYLDYNTFTLDANGIANISKTGISKFGMRLGWDINNSFTGTWSSLASTYYQFAEADSGLSTAPKLVVTYSIPVAASVFNIDTPSVSFRKLTKTIAY